MKGSQNHWIYVSVGCSIFALIVAFISAFYQFQAANTMVVINDPWRPKTLNTSVPQVGKTIGATEHIPNARTEIVFEDEQNREKNCGKEDNYSGIFAEPKETNLIYLYTGNGENICQYNKKIKKFTKMPWHFRVEGSTADLLTQNEQYMLGFGPSDSSGEIRSLLLTDLVNGTQKEIEKLEAPGTYIRCLSEFDGTPVGDITLWEQKDVFMAEIYLGSPIVGVGDCVLGDRSPIATKNIYPTNY